MTGGTLQSTSPADASVTHESAYGRSYLRAAYADAAPSTPGRIRICALGPPGQQQSETAQNPASIPHVQQYLVIAHGSELQV